MQTTGVSSEPPRWDFDTVVDRRGTDAPKWAGTAGGQIALSVADMDFPSPPAVRAAVAERASRGIFGYTDLAADHNNVVVNFLVKQHGWAVDCDAIVYCNRVVHALALFLEVWTAPGDPVLIHTPAYAPLIEVIRRSGRSVVYEALSRNDGRYVVDFDALRAAFRSGVRMMVLVNPHNPTGRVWTAGELHRLADLCLEHDVWIFSDDVHADFTRPGHPHTFLASLGEDVARRTVTCTSPGKSFNVPGLEITNLVIPDPAVRDRFGELMRGAGHHNPGFFASAVTRAAYRDSLDWLEDLRAYLAGNLDVLRRAFKAQLPAFRLTEPEGTYLAWIDASPWAAAELDELMVRAGLHVSSGRSFGTAYDHFFRVNYATPRSQLVEALDRLGAAYRSTPPHLPGATS